MEKNQLKQYCAIGAIAAAVCLFVLHFSSVIRVCQSILGAAGPLLLGAVIAYVLNILLKRIERLLFPQRKTGIIAKCRRPVSIVLSFLALFLILFFLIKLVVPELLSAVRLMTDEVPAAVETVYQWAIDNSGEIPAIQDALMKADINWQEVIKKAINVLLAGAGGLMNSVVTLVTGIFGTAAKLLIGSIFAIYLLSAKEKLLSQVNALLKAYVKPKTREKIVYVAETFHAVFTSFIVGQCMEAVIIGTLCALGMTVLGMPYAVMTGTVVGATALIPVVGAYIGAAVGAFMVFTVNPLQALLFVIFLVILQQLEGNLIYPRVVGSSIGLPGLWVLAAVTVGGGVFGIGGMLLGVPTAAAVYRLLQTDVKKRLDLSE